MIVKIRKPHNVAEYMRNNRSLYVSRPKQQEGSVPTEQSCIAELNG
jgi:hypothetical protein